MPIKRFIRKSLHRLGWDVRRYDPRTWAGLQLSRQLLLHHIDVVFDVGANTGQFVETLRDGGFRGRIVSFEPSSGAHTILSERARQDPNWIVAPRMAVGDREGVTTLNLAANSASSSVLPMLPSHLNAAPESAYIGSETVDLHTLDNVSTNLLSDSECVFLKLDVQGFEYRVLRGAEKFLRRVAGIQLEVSLTPLYDGESLFHPMLHYLEERGYELWTLIPGLIDSHTGRLLQLDAIFFRKEPPSSGYLKRIETLAQ